MARLAGVELDPRIPLEDEAGPRLRVAHYAQILAYFGMKPPVPEPPPVDMRRRNTLRVLESGAASDAAPAVDPPSAGRSSRVVSYTEPSETSPP